MKAHMTSKMAGPPARVALISNAEKPSPSITPDRASEAMAAAAPTPVIVPDDSARFREDILRRCETPFRSSWRHGGLND
jgi:hypothetical protein